MPTVSVLFSTAIRIEPQHEHERGEKMMITNAQATRVRNSIGAAAEAASCAVTVAICDAAGDAVLVDRPDGAAGFTAEIALAKARTAARFDNTTAALEELWSERPIYAHSLVAQGGWFIGRGGVPLTIDGQTVGAVGVSGDHPEHEATFAQRAADELAEQAAK
jgi:glc operon protein GlcG